MKQKIFLFISIISITLFSYSQNQEIWLLMKNNEKIIIRNDKVVVNDHVLNNMLHELNVDSLYKVFPYSKNDTLQRLYGFSTSIENVQGVLDGLAKINEIERRDRNDCII